MSHKPHKTEDQHAVPHLRTPAARNLPPTPPFKSHPYADHQPRGTIHHWVHPLCPPLGIGGTRAAVYLLREIIRDEGIRRRTREQLVAKQWAELGNPMDPRVLRCWNSDLAPVKDDLTTFLAQR
ncbi:jg12454 [Pararge aegeria aegeria]|uniref:Jg12454 protein n=1 Tax=Pararge aegeria aegeria TaxID=348720 RepID=A0A8S4RPL1_9NEOP|nr:jg12454 [Pararge aegeria aegeria]